MRNNWDGQAQFQNGDNKDVWDTVSQAGYALALLWLLRDAFKDLSLWDDQVLDNLTDGPLAGSGPERHLLGCQRLKPVQKRMALFV